MTDATPPEVPAATRALAREDVRGWIAGALGIAAFLLTMPRIFAAVTDVRLHDGDIGLLLGRVIESYGLIQLVTFLSYVPLTMFAFRGLAGAELRQVVRKAVPRATWTRKLAQWFGLHEVYTAITAGVVSLVCVVFVVAVPSVREASLAVSATLAAVVASWGTIVTAFAVRYMRLWAAGDADGPFDGEAAVFTDFQLVSMQVATSYNVTPLMLTSQRSRRDTLTQNLLGYVFNTVIVAMLVSVALPAIL